MVVRNPEQWRWLTPMFGVLNFTGTIFIGVIGYFLIRTVDQFDHHLERLDTKFEEQTKVNATVMQQLSFIKGRYYNQGKIIDDGI